MIAKLTGRIDYILLMTVFSLLVIGLLMVLSSSFDINYFLKQLISVVIGIVLMLIVMNVDYHNFQKLGLIFLLLSIFLLILTYIPGLGRNANGASRWLSFGGISFQPSELTKLALIFFLAKALVNKRQTIHNFKRGLLPLLAIIGLSVIFILKQPDLGTSLLIVMIGLVMLYIGGVSFNQLFLIILLGIPLVSWIILQNPYQKDRVLAFLNPWDNALGIGFQMVQAFIAIGSGGFFGMGLGHSLQKFSYLPQASTDYIFAIICEEFGFIGAVTLILLFVIILIRGFRIARFAPDQYGQLLAVGFTVWLGGEALLNILVVLGMVPPTGLPLTFISFGGTAVISSLIAVGILLNISKQLVFKQHATS